MNKKQILEEMKVLAKFDKNYDKVYQELVNSGNLFMVLDILEKFNLQDILDLAFFFENGAFCK